MDSRKISIFEMFHQKAKFQFEKKDSSKTRQLYEQLIAVFSEIKLEANIKLAKPFKKTLTFQ